MDWSEGEVLTAEDGVDRRSSKRHSHGGMADVKVLKSYVSRAL